LIKPRYHLKIFTTTYSSITHPDLSGGLWSVLTLWSSGESSLWDTKNKIRKAKYLISLNEQCHEKKNDPQQKGQRIFLAKLFLTQNHSPEKVLGEIAGEHFLLQEKIYFIVVVEFSINPNRPAAS
jgi:hypothetical protein